MALDPAELIPGGEPPKVHNLPDMPMIGEKERFDPMKDIMGLRNIRMFLLNTVGKNFNPNDPKTVQLLMSMLKDADSAALGAMRIQIEDKSTDGAEAAKLLAAAVLKLVSDPKTAIVLPSQVNGNVVDVKATEIEPPSLPDDIETRPFVPGEASQGTIHQTYDQFKDRVGGVVLAAKTKIDD